MPIDTTFETVKRWMLGNPLPSRQEKHERLGIPIALAVFASDALSSTAYATEEILLALVSTVYAGQANFLSLPVAVAIALLMAIVVLSYRQVIIAFPEGGGTYEVSKARLGITAAQIAAAALLIDYVLTVAVSVSAGISAVVSSGLVGPFWQLPLSLIAILLVTLINLRGVRESGRVLAFPAYFFIGSMLLLLVMGAYKVFTGQVPPVQAMAGAQPVIDTSLNWAMVLVLLNAFSHGCAALTGIEVISNGVKAFKEPAYKNANRTMVIMGSLLALIFVGITLLAWVFHLVPNEAVHQTVIAMVATAVFGYQTPLFFAFQAATMIILILAANTSFSGFPRLASIIAHDGFMPRQLMSLGDRLVFSNGILILGITSFFLVWLYKADTHALIPLYAVGVFLSFTLAQAGMVVHHLQEKQPGWQMALPINALGAITTGVVTLILLIEKFTAGAWLLLIAIPGLMWIFRSIYNHYKAMGRQLALPATGYCPLQFEHTALVLVSSLNKGTIPAMEYAKSIAKNVEAVHIELNPEATKRLKQAWDEWGCGIPLTILKSPYRSISGPLIKYVEEVETRHEHDVVTIVVPEFVTRHWWHNLLHNQTSLLIQTLLRWRKGKIVTTVRYYLDE